MYRIANFSVGGSAVNRRQRFTTGSFTPEYTASRPPGRQHVGDPGESGEVEVANGDLHAVGLTVGLGQDGTQMLRELWVAVGVEDSHSCSPC